MATKPGDVRTATARVFCVTDPTGRVAVVIERRPQKWWRLGSWDLVRGDYREGAWFRGTLYPQRCDLSPDGRWFCYFAFKNDSAWPAGPTYNAISRPPWLKTLAAWQESGTWSRGFHFVTDPGVWEIGDPTVGEAHVRGVFGLRQTTPAQFATERRRGWRESASTPPRDPEDVWDERRDVVMEKPAPCGGRSAVLTVTGKFEAFRDCSDLWPPNPAAYQLLRRRTCSVVEGAHWADWTPESNLAVATHSGALQIRDGLGERVIREFVLGDDRPQPTPAPAWAGEW